MVSLITDALDAATLVAAIGSASLLVEQFASTVAAGVVLGGFLLGARELFAKRRPAEGHLSDAGYMGGIGAVACMLWDALRLGIG